MISQEEINQNVEIDTEARRFAGELFFESGGDIRSSDCVIAFKKGAEFMSAKLEAARGENTKLISIAKYFLIMAERHVEPDIPVVKGLNPTCYHTLSFEGDVVLVEHFKKTRQELIRITEAPQPRGDLK